MKKTLLTCLVALVASLSSAVTLNWNATKVSFGGVQLKSDAGVTGYLIYLGGTGSTLKSSYAIAEGATATSVSSSIGTLVTSQNKTTSLAKLNNNYTFDLGTDYNNGDVFAMLLVYNDGTKDRFNLSTGVYTMSGAIADPPTNPANADFSMSYSNGTDGTLTAGGGWVAAAAVPEPATGALALAGIALLLKRRKAAKA